jgi:hypothetical protein
VHLVLAAQGIRSPVLQQTEQNLTHNGLYNLKVSSPKNNVTKIARKVLSNLSKILRAYEYKMAENSLSHMLLKLINDRA